MNHLDWRHANSKKRWPNMTWSLEDMPPGTPSHRAQKGVTGVYFIPMLKANIVSLGQLDKAGCHISIKRGLLRIRDDRRRLLTQV